MKEDKYPEGSHDHFYFCPGPKSGYYSGSMKIEAFSKNINT